MRSQKKEESPDSFLLFILSLFPTDPCRPLFTIILGFYSHILSSLGTVKASFHLLIACSACNHCCKWWVVWSPTWRGLQARKALHLQPQVSWELQGPRALDRLLPGKAPLLENKVVSQERERARSSSIPRNLLQPQPWSQHRGPPQGRWTEWILKRYHACSPRTESSASHIYNIDI